MNQEEKLVLTTVNLALEAHDLPHRFALHPNFPMTRVFYLTIDRARTLRIWTAFRRLDIFEERPPGSFWGNTKTIGTYKGTGWLPQLAQEAVDATTSPPQVPT